MKDKFIFILLAFVLSTIAVMPPETVKAKEPTGRTAIQEYVEAMQPGWNLGNTFDATGDETSWGNPKTTKEMIDAIAAAGFKSIRIPITWDHRMGDASDYMIDPDFLSRIKEVVDWSLDAGLYVMLNMHHDSWLWVYQMGMEYDEVLARYKATWQQISEYFKDYPKELMFESINEPFFEGDILDDFELLNELNASFYNIVRESGSNNVTRPLVLPTLSTSSEQRHLDELSDTIANLDDDNIIATVHFYGFWPFSVNIAGKTTFDDDVKNDLEGTVDRVYNTFVAKSIPVIIGEYGLLGFDVSVNTIQHGEMLKFFEYLTYYANSKDLTLMWWDNGQHFDRQSLNWRDEQLYNIIMKGLRDKERSSYTERDFIFIQKDKPIQDVKLNMYLNGNSLTNIRNGNEELVKGIDYDADNDTLILKSNLLKDLISEEYGTNATLTCYFSKGASWNIDIIYYDKPKLKQSTGTIDDFLIPTDFNGDRLATMEAIYEDGTNAGPHDWTSFKEFGYTFMPLYDSNHIKLTDRFFNEIRDGEILLKMHFWSGNIVEYKLKKEGINILGELYIVEEPEPELEPDLDPEPEPEPESKPDSESGLAPELEPGKMETSKKINIVDTTDKSDSPRTEDTRINISFYVISTILSLVVVIYLSITKSNKNIA